jgi:hypothetical protein
VHTSVLIVKPGGYGDPQAAHLGQVGALAAEQILHLGVAVGSRGTEYVYVLCLQLT